MVRGIDLPSGYGEPRRSQSGRVIRKLRMIASFALGGAVMTGVVFGHDAAGMDPRTIGAGVGLTLGILAWATGHV